MQHDCVSTGKKHKLNNTYESVHSDIETLFPAHSDVGKEKLSENIHTQQSIFSKKADKAKQ